MDIHVFNGLKESIAESFKEEARKLLPWYKYGSKDITAFEKAAEICYRIDADPVLFVKAQFNNIKNIDHFQSSFLHTQYAESKYREYVQKNCINETPIAYEDLYQTQLSYLRNLIQSGLTVEQALMKDYVNLKNWFRILITKEPVQEVIDKYKSKVFPIDEALLHFLKEKKFDLSRLC